MRFKVGASRYSVVIAPGPLTFEGTPSLAATMQADRQILIAGDAPVSDRPRLLMRELMHAWIMETGEPKRSEGWVDLCATVTMATVNDLNFQGGEMGLMGLRSGESPEPGAVRSGLSTNRQCAVCQSTVAGGSVIWRPASLPGLAELRIYCEFCGHTQIWTEGLSARGLPNCIPIGEPTFERGDRTGARLIGVQDDAIA